MASEAQRLIGISLTKIAQSRSHRGGVSLHKNLLVATVLQKARFIFMEEAYNMVHYQSQAPIQTRPINDEQLVGLTAEEAGIESTTGLPDDVQETGSDGGGRANNNNNSEFDNSGVNSENLQDFLQPTTMTCVKCAENQNKENHPPSYHPSTSSSASTSSSSSSTTELTYLDLDKTSTNILRERSNSSPACLKRRRAIAEWETEEAVQSILPKRSRNDDDSNDDSVFLDDATLLSDVVSKEMLEIERQQQQQQQQENSSSSSSNTTATGPAMEMDRISSLVSIFSFNMGDGGNKLNRSMSTPDLCSAQAKDAGDTLQQRPFLAMTV